MIRRKVPHRAIEGASGFRWRGGEVSRIEGLSDAVFALSLTLLVVSLDVPASYGEMRTAFLDIPAFAASFAVLMMLWVYHFQFHRRYGLEDGITLALNAVLLFIILIYVYPLKFLFTFLGRAFTGRETGRVLPDGTRIPALQDGDMSSLLLTYSAGFTGIFLLFALMTWHAYRKREQLELDEAECLVARGSIREHLLSASLGVISMLIAALGSPRVVPLAGMIYALMGPLHTVFGILHGKKVQRALERRPAGVDNP